MDEEMVKRWNSVVKPEDTVYHLGDVAMYTKAMLRTVPRLNGNKILITGNHDYTFEYFTKTRGQKFTDQAIADYKKAGFTAIYRHARIDGNGKILEAGDTIDFTRNDGIVLTHIPGRYISDPYSRNQPHKLDPYKVEILKNQAVFCGHVHDSWLKKKNHINVGVDVHDFYPVSLEEAVILLVHEGDLSAPKRFRRFVFANIAKVLNLFRAKRPVQHRKRR